MIKISRIVKNILKPVYTLLRNIYYKILDIYDILKGNKDPLVPPRSMIFIGDGDFLKIGNEFLSYFISLGNIKPDHKILDVGCGIGRMALPLTKYLSSKGEYFGFDIVESGITWCNEKISPKYPNFYFSHADILNKTYNPKGKVLSSQYTFEYQNDFFDFVLLTSVFTHMETKDVARYLEEISRVLKSGGKCLITFFLINDESNKLINEKNSTQLLKYQIDDYSFAKDKNIPEHAIGFKEDFVEDLFIKNNLTIEKIYYGSWCGRKNYKSYQDIVIAKSI